MTDEQGDLPLRMNDTVTGKSLRESRPDLLKALDKALKAATPLAKPSKTSLGERLSVLDKVIAALKVIDVESVLRDLESEQATLAQGRDAAFARRREELLRAAKEAGCSARRLKDYDFVGGFRVNYKRERVTLNLGSEIFDVFDEVEGARLFLRIKEARQQLDGFLFRRSDFFRAIKDALGFARVRGQTHDGRVPIREIYPLVVLVRQSYDDRFLKHPNSKSFSDYSMAQFVYDFARFGHENWRMDGERLANQPPNMATAAKGRTVTLPSLDGDGSGGPQLGSVSIQRIESP